MRPHLLTPLFASLTALKGIGPRVQTTLKRLFPPVDGAGEPKVADLLFHFPTGLVDRRSRPTIAQARPGQIATLSVTVVNHAPPPRGNKRIPYRVACEDETGEIDLIFFHAQQKYLEGQLPPGQTRIVSGRLDEYGGKLQMPHPDYIVSEQTLDELPLLEPVYPLTAGLSGKVLLRAVTQAVERVPDMPEWQDGAWLKQQGWPTFAAAIAAAHAPETEAELLHAARPRQRIAYDELLANQLALALVRSRLQKSSGREIAGTGVLKQKIIDTLPFELTPSQGQVLGEIAADMAAPHRMLRLLQGDVGSGKTIVALLAMASAVEAGFQAALMAPTEVLARQHLKTLDPIALQAGFSVALLTGREKGTARKKLLAELESGSTYVLIGTQCNVSRKAWQGSRDLAIGGRR